MGYIDLLLMRTPGKKVAIFAQRAVSSLDHVAGQLTPMERAGASVPATPLFGGSRGRLSVRYALSSAESALSGGASTARTFASRAPDSQYPSFTSVISDAQTAHDRTRSLTRRWDFPRQIARDIDDAAYDAQRAVDELERARYGSDQTRRHGASYAASSLDDARWDLDRADREVRRMLEPYRRYDNLRISSENNLSEAAYDASTASRVRKVREETRALATAGFEHANDALATLVGLRPQDSTKQVRTAVNASRGSLTEARANALTEPTPPWFAAKVAAAYAVTLAGVGGAAYGVYHLTRPER